MHDWGFHKALCERGYLAAGWPVEVGGLGRSAIDQTLLMQELYGAGAPIDGLNIASMVGATLLLRGTDEQRAEVLPRILAGEVMCCLGYSEPDAGSDVAAVATRAVRDGDQLGDRRPEDVHDDGPRGPLRVPAVPAPTSTCPSTRA